LIDAKPGIAGLCFLGFIGSSRSALCRINVGNLEHNCHSTEPFLPAAMADNRANMAILLTGSNESI
jgi:hypothetical protein